MRRRLVGLAEGFNTIQDAGHPDTPRVLYDDGHVTLVYEREVGADRTLIFETNRRIVRVRQYPSTWRQSSDFDLLDLRDGVDVS
jgi:hypothetical protein